MYIYLVKIEKDAADYDGSVVYTHTDKEKAIAMAERMDPTVYVERWPLQSTMTYQNVEVVYARG